MDPRAAVRLVLEMLAQRAEATDRELVEGLRVNGAALELATRAVIFVPLAFGRALLRGAGVRFPREFESIAGDGAHLRPLESEDVYVAASEAADVLMPRDRALFARLAERSPEFKAIQEAMAAGSALDELALAPLRLAI